MGLGPRTVGPDGPMLHGCVRVNVPTGCTLFGSEDGLHHTGGGGLLSHRGQHVRLERRFDHLRIVDHVGFFSEVNDALLLLVVHEARLIFVQQVLDHLQALPPKQDDHQRKHADQQRTTKADDTVGRPQGSTQQDRFHLEPRLRLQAVIGFSGAAAVRSGFAKINHPRGIDQMADGTCVA